MKIRYLMPVSGDKIIGKGEVRDVKEDVALRLIAAGVAEATTAKAQEEAHKKIAGIAEKEAQKEAELQRLLQKEELEAEKSRLKERLEEIETILKEK